MKTLKYIPVPEDSYNLLAWAENDAYRVTIRYFGEGDLSNKKIEEISGADLIITVMPKENIYPYFSIVLEDEKIGLRQDFFVDLKGKEVISLDQIDSFIEVMKVAGDTLADIKEMLIALGPQFVHEEPESVGEEPIIPSQCEEQAGRVKTLRYLSVPEDNPHLLFRAENDIYEVKIRYFGDKDPASVDRSELTAEDLMINVHIKKRAPFICPELKVVLGNKSLGIQQWFYIQQRMTDMICLEEIPEFLSLLALARDTLTDIRELLLELVPDCVQ